tara:strand:+ start:1273 stop:1674 length:402 start_codon:yes stop_codon:yes gene_type:complete
MQYIKHYYVDDDNNTFCCETTSNPKYKRHPSKEYAGLSVKIWLTDSDGVEVCLAELPDETTVSTISDANSAKNSIQVLTEVQYNTVATPYFEAQTLYSEARQAREQNDETTAAAKESAAATKITEATTAIRAL